MTAEIADECRIRFGSENTTAPALAALRSQPEVAPSGELVFEMRSLSEPWLKSLEKMLDHRKSGVKVVVVLDPKTKSASVFRPRDRPEVVPADSTLTIPDVLPGFTIQVGKFFE